MIAYITTVVVQQTDMITDICRFVRATRKVLGKYFLYVVNVRVIRVVVVKKRGNLRDVNPNSGYVRCIQVSKIMIKPQ